jgi:hypothetical protein
METVKEPSEDLTESKESQRCEEPECRQETDNGLDGGFAAWSVVFGAWCCLFCAFGWVNGMISAAFKIYILQIPNKIGVSQPVAISKTIMRLISYATFLLPAFRGSFHWSLLSSSPLDSLLAR